MNRTFLRISLLLTFSVAGALAAQTTSYPLSDGTSMQLPDLTIAGSTLSCDVTYVPARSVYRYAYTLNAPATNLAPVRSFRIELSGTNSRVQLDPTLSENIRRWTVKQPTTTIPVGVTSPDLTQWADCSVAADGWAYCNASKWMYSLAPGSSRSGFVLESHQPPGIRRAVILPSMHAWWEAVRNAPSSDAEFETPLSAARFAIQTTTVGPSEITEAELYSGGGQQPAEVNKFLRYASPLDNRNKVPANSTYTVLVYYGLTINPATFNATLDGVDITSRFHPTPGGADAVTIAVGTGTTKLHLSVDGTKASGGKGTDSDTLTFLPQ
jgi:hypothetical protein